MQAERRANLQFAGRSRNGSNAAASVVSVAGVGSGVVDATGRPLAMYAWRSWSCNRSRGRGQRLKRAYTVACGGVEADEARTSLRGPNREICEYGQSALFQFSQGPKRTGDRASWAQASCPSFSMRTSYRRSARHIRDTHQQGARKTRHATNAARGVQEWNCRPVACVHLWRAIGSARR